jgi:hypothetical protein
LSLHTADGTDEKNGSRVASYGIIFTLNLAKGQSNGLADFKKGQTDILT